MSAPHDAGAADEMQHVLQCRALVGVPAVVVLCVLAQPVLARHVRPLQDMRRQLGAVPVPESPLPRQCRSVHQHAGRRCGAACAGGGSCRAGTGFQCGTCAAGYQFAGASCVDIDECALAGALCPSNSICINKIGSFECSCVSPYVGAFSGVGVAAFATVRTLQCAIPNPCSVNNGGCSTQRTCVFTNPGAYCADCQPLGGFAYANLGPYGCVIVLVDATLSGVVGNAITGAAITSGTVSVDGFPYSAAIGSQRAFG